jgi:hypothetical protein
MKKKGLYRKVSCNLCFDIIPLMSDVMILWIGCGHVEYLNKFVSDGRRKSIDFLLTLVALFGIVSDKHLMKWICVG